MAFSDYMNSLPNLKVEEVNKIAELTSSSVMTVYRWISHKAEPPLVKKKIIASYLQKKGVKITIEDLFPDQSETDEVNENIEQR